MNQNDPCLLQPLQGVPAIPTFAEKPSEAPC
jgi:hypothetical protein